MWICQQMTNKSCIYGGLQVSGIRTNNKTETDGCPSANRISHVYGGHDKGVSYQWIGKLPYCGLGRKCQNVLNTHDVRQIKS